MAIIATQLDKVKKALSLRSDADIARLFEVTPQTVSLWRAGDAYPDEDKIAQMANMAKEDDGAWLIQVRAERTEGPAKKAWKHALERLSPAAAAVGMFLLCAIPFPENAHARAVLTEQVPTNVYYVIRRILQKWRARSQQPFSRIRDKILAKLGRSTDPEISYAPA